MQGPQATPSLVVPGLVIEITPPMVHVQVLELFNAG